MNLTDAIEQEDDGEETAFSPALEATSGKISLRGAINGYCRDCIYDGLDKGAGNWRQQVEACTVTKCSLYLVRPISKPRKATRLPSGE